ncbi:CHAT domain-containing protein [bacterium]|nr:CHAT domain-containing protein [bacterium]
MALLIIQSLIPFAYGQFTVSHVKRPDTNPANTEFNRAEKLAFQAQYDSAIGVFQNAIVKFAKRNDWVGVAECYNRIGDNFKEKAKFDSALYYSNRALECALDKLGNQHSALIRIYNSIGFVFWNVAEYDSSLQYYNKAIAIRHSEKDPDIAQTYFCLALYYRVKGNYDMALDYHNKALAIRLEALGPDNIEVAHSYHAMGLVYFKLEDYDKAIEYLKKTLDIKQSILNSKHPSLEQAYNALGTVHWNKSDVASAMVYYHKALSISLDLYGYSHPNMATYCDNMGIIYGDQGDYYKSIEYCQKAIEIRLRSFGENHKGLLRSYKAIGFAYQQIGDYRKSLGYYELAHKLSVQLYGTMDSNTVNCYYYFASIYSAMGNHDKSIEYYMEILDLISKIKGTINSDMGYGYRNLGIEYELKQDSEKALVYYHLASSIYSEIYSKKHFRIGEVFNDIGTAYSTQLKFEKALEWFQKAINELIVDFGDTNIYSNPPLKNILMEQELLISLRSKAENFEKLYSVRSHDLKHLQMSSANYDLASELVDKIRVSYKTEGSKLNLVSTTNRLYEEAIKVALQLYKHTQDEFYKHKAFTYAEKSKSVVLLEALSDLKAIGFASIPDSLLEKERNFKVNLAFYETRLQKEKSERNDIIEIQKTENKLFSLNYGYESLILNFEVNYPVYHNLKYKTTVVSVENLQRQLDSDQVLLEYFLGENSMIIYTISKDRFTACSMAKDTALEFSVRELRESLFNLDPAGYIDNASKLYRWLINPVAKDIKGYKKLLIIPDGVLNYLPFETLLTKQVKADGSPDFATLPYLIKYYQISYDYSSTLITQRPKDPGFANSFLGIAPVFLSGTISQSSLPDTSRKGVNSDLASSAGPYARKMSSLPYTDSELKDIDSLFRRNNLTTRICLLDRATEKVIKSDEAKRFKYIHIASHGFIDESNPKLSGIAFSQSDSTEDGILYAGEMYNLPLKADLVVLSACESGLGKIVRGEGIMSLTRGFICSGAQNVIVSLWQVKDQSTAVLMKQLYEGILNGQSNSEALHGAKLRLIQNPRFVYPFDWGSFVLIGR